MKKVIGFTLIELMVALTVAGIVLAIGVPSFQAMIQNNRLVSQSNDVVTSIHLARSEAVKRGTSVTICGSTNPTDADPSCNTANWEGGWIVFVDNDDDGVHDTGEEVLRINEASTNNVTVRPGVTRITFNSQGFRNDGQTLNDVDASGTRTGVSICDDRGGSDARGIVIGTLGQLTSWYAEGSSTGNCP